MSNINIKRAVENIRANTTVYTPVVETIVNAIQAIDESGRTDGKVSVRALRNSQAELYGSLPNVTSFDIQDNGIGFTDEHRDSFDTLSRTTPLPPRLESPQLQLASPSSPKNRFRYSSRPRSV